MVFNVEMPDLCQAAIAAMHSTPQLKPAKTQPRKRLLNIPFIKEEIMNLTKQL